MIVLFHNARILTMLDDTIINGDLVVDNNRIAYIGKESKDYGPFDRIIECNQKVLMPGFKNAHAHSAMVFLRDVPENVSPLLFSFIVAAASMASVMALENPVPMLANDSSALVLRLFSVVLSIPRSIDASFPPTPKSLPTHEF